MPPPCVTVDSEGESDTSLELSSEDSDSDTETNYLIGGKNPGEIISRGKLLVGGNY